jgi:hypothetical protein
MTPRFVKGAQRGSIRYNAECPAHADDGRTHTGGAVVSVEEEIQGLHRQIANEETSAKMLIALLRREFRGPSQMLEWKIRDKQSHVDNSVRILKLRIAELEASAAKGEDGS